MLLFCGGIPTWILFINIFIKSSIVWILIPYDMFINNICLFLIYSENQYLYKLLFLNCHKGFFHCCFFLQSDEQSDNDKQIPIPSKSFDASKSSQDDDKDALDEKYEHQVPQPNDYNIPPPPMANCVPLQAPNNPYGQYLNVQLADHGYKDSKNEGGFGMNLQRMQNQNNDAKSYASSVDFSHSNIIKGIVMN